jgi:hypothetical protein
MRSQGRGGERSNALEVKGETAMSDNALVVLVLGITLKLLGKLVKES